MSGCMRSGRLRWIGGWLLLAASTLIFAAGGLGLFSAWRNVTVQYDNRAAGAAEGVLIASVWSSTAVPSTSKFEVSTKPRKRPFVWWIERDPMMRSCMGVVATQGVNAFGISSWTIMCVWWFPLLVGSTGVGAGYWIVSRARRRRHIGACVDCGYSMAGLSQGATCPECGSTDAVTIR